MAKSEDKIALTTKKILDSEPKMIVTVRREGDEDEDDYAWFAINGHSFQIKKEVPVEVPESLAALIRNTDIQKEEKRKRLAELSKNAEAPELN